MTVVASTAAERDDRVRRWPSERPLFAVIVLVSIGVWVALVVSIVGILYALLIGIFFFLAHVIFVAHVRGSSVRLGEDQLPELYARVKDVAARIGFKTVPEAYLLQAGGVLNALATRFRRANMIVLYSELVDACDGNPDALDFVVAHELGHLKAGHLNWRWFLLPGLIFPFLGQAYSRACEYTCDRYGIAAAGNRDRGLDGLVILAAGPRQAVRVSRRSLTDQARGLDTVWMRIGHWLTTHPPIAERLAALDPSLAPRRPARASATIGAIALIVGVFAVPAALGYLVIDRFGDRIEAWRSQFMGAATGGASTNADVTAEVEAGIMAFVAVIEETKAAGEPLPATTDDLYALWAERRPAEDAPMDPHYGARYELWTDGSQYIVYTLGYDPNDASDDLFYDSSQARP